MEESPGAALDKTRLEFGPLAVMPDSHEIARLERQLEERLSRIHSGESEHTDIAERVLFWIDNKCYSVALSKLREALVEIPSLTPLPFSPSWLLGLFPLRTDLVTLVDPRPILDRGPDVAEDDIHVDVNHAEQALLIGASGRLIAIMVDRIGDIVSGPHIEALTADTVMTRSSASARYIQGVPQEAGGGSAEVAIALDIGAFYDDVISALEVWSRHV
jgi:chemotaxis signal transduction protein